MSRLTSTKLPFILLCILAAALGMKQMLEPDLWWIIRVGEWIVQNTAVPTQDMLSYTYEGVEWINVKWLFELLAYFTAINLGPESIAALQMLMNIGMVLFMAKDALLFQKRSTDLSQITLSVLLILILALFGMEFRMIARPEMTTHLLTIVFIYLYHSHLYRPSNKIFWLIPLQILWTNAHEAFGTGMVLLALFMGASFVQKLFTKKAVADTKLYVASAIAFVSVIVNPRGWEMLLHPLNIFSQVGDNKFTKELNSAFQDPDFYFGHFQPWILIALVLLISGGLVYLIYQKGLKQALEEFTLVDLGLLVAFTYLGLTAHRNVAIGLIVLAPMGAWAVQQFAQRKSIKAVSWSVPASILILVLIIGVTTDSYYKLSGSKYRYGLVVDATSNPKGSVDYLKANGLENAVGFSDYLISAYPLWEMRPGFKSFIDLRDLDVFPKEFFQAYGSIINFPDKFEQTHQQYDYKYILLHRNTNQVLHNYLYNSEQWSLAYVDLVSAVYLPSTENASVQWSTIPRIEPSSFASALSMLLNPLFDADESYVYNEDLQASMYFANVRDFDRATSHLEQAIKSPKYSTEANFSLAKLYMQQAMSIDSDSARLELFRKAQTIGKKLSNDDRSAYEGHLVIGMLRTYLGKEGEALSSFKKAHDLRPNDVEPLLLESQALIKLMNRNPDQARTYFDRWLIAQEAAFELDQNNQQVIMRLCLAYLQLNNCEKALFYHRLFEPFPGISKSDLNAISEGVKKCKR